MTTRARLTTLLILAVALLASSGCLFSTPEKPGGDTDGPEYLDYTTPDNMMTNFVEAWNHMDFAEYRDHILYDGEELANDGASYEAFKFYFIEDTGDGPSWGIEEEKAHTHTHTHTQYGQANKGLRWMPWSYLARKAVVSCEKLRGGANIHRSAGSRMG